MNKVVELMSCDRQKNKNLFAISQKILEEKACPKITCF